MHHINLSQTPIQLFNKNLNVMKRLFVLLLVVYIVPGIAIAQNNGNTADVNQEGDGNTATVNQQGNNHESSIDQIMGGAVGHTAVVNQSGGDGNYSDIQQGNRTTPQAGQDGEVYVTQVGSENESRIFQKKGPDVATVNQTGTKNKVGGYENYDNPAEQVNSNSNWQNKNNLTVSQSGEENKAGLFQSNRSDAAVQQSGNYNEVKISQNGYMNGNRNFVNADQVGDDNFAHIYQEGKDNIVNYNQTGSNNGSDFSQMNYQHSETADLLFGYIAGQNFPTVGQWGVNNTARSFITGDGNNSLILQSGSNQYSEELGADAIINGDNNYSAQLQFAGTTGNTSSVINITGSNNIAASGQMGAHTSNISIVGSGNQAIIYQNSGSN